MWVNLIKLIGSDYLSSLTGVFGFWFSSRFVGEWILTTFFQAGAVLRAVLRAVTII